MSCSSSSGTVPPPYTPYEGPPGSRNERSPLISGLGQDKSSKVPGWVYILVAAAVLTFPVFVTAFGIQTHRVQALTNRMAQYPQTPAELDVLRRELDEVRRDLALELTAHKQLQEYDKWAEDRLTFEREREKWLVTRREYQVDQANWEQHRIAYEADTEDWRKAGQEYELSRKHWTQQQDDWHRERKGWDQERNRWELEQARRSRDWIKGADQYRLDAGTTLGLSWDHVESHHCVAHGIRTYTARLAFEGDKACDHMPIEINGAIFGTPEECRREGDYLVSRWDVNIGEASCKIYWGDLRDKGCHDLGKHRFEARLIGLDEQDNWMAMCHTAPIDIRGEYFDQPLQCENRGMFYGTIGTWDIEDKACQ